MQPERTVRVAAVATKQRQPSDGERQPVRTRLSAGDGTAGPQQPRASVKGRLSRPAAGQAPLQAPPQVCQQRKLQLTHSKDALSTMRKPELSLAS